MNNTDGFDELDDDWGEGLADEQAQDRRAAEVVGHGWSTEPFNTLQVLRTFKPWVGRERERAYDDYLRDREIEGLRL